MEAGVNEVLRDGRHSTTSPRHPAAHSLRGACALVLDAHVEYDASAVTLGAPSDTRGCGGGASCIAGASAALLTTRYRAFPLRTGRGGGDRMSSACARYLDGRRVSVTALQGGTRTMRYSYRLIVPVVFVYLMYYSAKTRYIRPHPRPTTYIFYIFRVSCCAATENTTRAPQCHN